MTKPPQVESLQVALADGSWISSPDDGVRSTFQFPKSEIVFVLSQNIRLFELK
jgi:hypothetical protein